MIPLYVKKMWDDISLKGIAKIEKLVGEYNIWELEKSPYEKFKIKIFKDSIGLYSGYTNLQIVDACGDYYCAVGHGESEEVAMKDTITQFFKMVSWKDEWEEKDFQCSDPFDF